MKQVQKIRLLIFSKRIFTITSTTRLTLSRTSSDLQDFHLQHSSKPTTNSDTYSTRISTSDFYNTSADWQITFVSKFKTLLSGLDVFQMPCRTQSCNRY